MEQAPRGLEMENRRLKNEIKQLYEVVAGKDRILQRQTEELEQLGELKLKCDQIHQEQFVKAKETIFSLKKQIAIMKRDNAQQPNEIHSQLSQLPQQQKKSD